MYENDMKKVTIPKIIIYIFLVLLAFLYLTPLFWVFNVSFNTNVEIITAPFALPNAPTFENFSFAWKAGKIGIATGNSFVV